jgi:hypothetical protein
MSDLSDFFGGGVPSRGEYNVPLAASIGGMGDVNITSPSNYEALVYFDGYWVNQDIAYTNITGAPPIYTSLNTFFGTLTDVDISPLNTGDILRWNDLNKWEAVALTELLTLGNLSGVTVGGENPSDVLVYDSGWINRKLDHTDLDLTAYVPDVSAVNIEQLANVAAGSPDQYLLWDGAGTSVISSATIPTSAIAGLNPIADASNTNTYTSGDIDLGIYPIDAPTPVDGDVLTFDGVNFKWVADAPAAGGDPTRITDGGVGANECYVDTNEIADSIVIKAGPTTGDIILTPNGTGTVQIVGTGDAVIESDDNILITSNLNDVVIQGITYPSGGAVLGKVLAVINTNELGFITQTAGVTDLDDLTSVNPSLAPTDGQFFRYVGAPTNKWNAHTLVLSDADDVVDAVNTNAAAVTGSSSAVLFYNESLIPPKWDAKKLTVADVDMTAYTPTLTLDGLSNVHDSVSANANAITGSKAVLYYNNSAPAGEKWNAKQLALSDINTSGVSFATFPIVMSLADLSNVNDSLPTTSGQYLYRNATEWTSKQIEWGDILTTSLPDFGAYAFIDTYSQCVGAPFLPGGMAVNLNEMADVIDYDPNTITNGWVLTWNTSSSPARWEPKAPATTVTQLSQLTGDVVIAAPTDNQMLVYDTTNPTINRWKNTTVNVSMAPVAEVAGTITLTPSEVNVSGPMTTNQVLKWDGTDWVNAQLSYSNLSGVPVLDLNDLDDVVITGVATNDEIKWNGTNWVNYSPTVPFRIDDSDDGNEGAFVDVGLDPSNVLISAGDGAVATGGNIIMTPNTGTNADAAVIIEGDGGTDVYIMSDDTINIQSTAGVNIQGITYPDLDGLNGHVLTTNGAGVATFQLPSVPSTYIRTFKDGLTLSYTSTTTITVGTGAARDATNAQTITMVAPMIKGLVAGGWVSGAGNGGLPTAVTLAANRYYYVFIIAKQDMSAVDIAFDNSKTGANILADAAIIAWANTTPYIRRIGIVYTPETNTNISPFYQNGDEIVFNAPLDIYSNAPGRFPTYTPTGSEILTTNMPDSKLNGYFFFTTEVINSGTAAEIVVVIGHQGYLDTNYPIYRGTHTESYKLYMRHFFPLTINKPNGAHINYKFNHDGFISTVLGIGFRLTSISEDWSS